MKKLMFILIPLIMLIASCGMRVWTPYGQIETDTDSQIFVYTDVDVDIRPDRVTSDDTTLIIVGVKDNTGADLKSIFTHALTEIKEIFKARQAVYDAWIKDR